MRLTISCEQETDGRWLAEVEKIPGVLCYGQTAQEAKAKAKLLAFRVLEEQLLCAFNHPPT